MSYVDEKIEYYALNLWEGVILEHKHYYYWNEKCNMPLFPVNIKCLLNPFDYCRRNGVYKRSMSFFLKREEKRDLISIVDYMSECHKIRIDKDKFIHDFIVVQDFKSGCHYEPIISVKYNDIDTEIDGVSFYVSALRNKSNMCEYFSVVRSLYENSKNKDLFRLLEYNIKFHYADLFLISWDYSKCKIAQNKIYIKIKNLQMVCSCLDTYGLAISDYIWKEGFRFSVLAFVLKDGLLSQMNLYFKPV